MNVLHIWYPSWYESYKKAVNNLSCKPYGDVDVQFSELPCQWQIVEVIEYTTHMGDYLFLHDINGFLPDGMSHKGSLVKRAQMVEMLREPRGGAFNGVVKTLSHIEVPTADGKCQTKLLGCSTHASLLYEKSNITEDGVVSISRCCPLTLAQVDLGSFFEQLRALWLRRYVRFIENFF